MKNLDFFGEPFNFNYNGDYHFKTKFSAAISVLVLILTAFYGIWNIILMLQHNGLIINSYQTNLSNDDYYTMGDDQFLGFRIVDSNGTDIFSKSHDLRKYFFIWSMFFGWGNYTNQLPFFRCNTTNNKLLPNSSNIICVNLNGSKLGGNFFAVDGVERSYIQFKMAFDYDQFVLDYANSSPDDFTIRFPLLFSVISPMTILNLLNHDRPTTDLPQSLYFALNYNTSKFIIKKTGLIEINTDLSFITYARSTQTFVSSSPSYNSEI